MILEKPTSDSATSHLLQVLRDKYQIQDMEKDGWVYMKIVKGMPGLKQSARLANERLVHRLAPYGYGPVEHTPSLWKHESNRILFLPS